MTTVLHRKCKDGSTTTWSTRGNFKGGKIQKKCLHCGNKFSVFLYRKDTAKYCSRHCLASNRVGKLSSNWKGGISEVSKLIRGGEEYNTWRKSVYQRDNWTCKHCDIKQKHPVAHHIKTFKDYPDLRFELDNGITLCRSCHKKVHSEIGVKTRFSRNEEIINPSLTLA